VALVARAVEIVVLPLTELADTFSMRPGRLSSLHLLRPSERPLPQHALEHGDRGHTGTGAGRPRTGPVGHLGGQEKLRAYKLVLKSAGRQGVKEIYEQKPRSSARANPWQLRIWTDGDGRHVAVARADGSE
jgi:hypothetical protein